MKLILWHVLSTLAMTSLAAPVNAAAVVNYSNNMASYLAATGAVSIGTLPSTTPASPMIVGSVTFTAALGSSLALNPAYTNEFDRPLAISNEENFNMDISGGAFSIGFQIHEPSYNRPYPTFSTNFGCNATCHDTLFRIELFSGAISLGYFEYNAPDDRDFNENGDSALGFFGVHSDTAFDRVTVRDITDTPDNELFGNFTLGRAALQTNGVAEPGTLALMLAALGAMTTAGAGRRRA